MQHLLNQMRFQSGIGQNFITQMKFGLVTSYNPQNSYVIVQIQPINEEDPQGSLTGWIPYLSPWAGFQGAPRINDQVGVVFQEGDINSGVAIGIIYSDEDLPPGAPSGELWITHPSGTTIKIMNDGNIQITANNDLNISAQNINVNAPQFNLIGDLNVTGNISATQNISDQFGTMQNIRTVYDSHTHPLSGGGDTGVPNQPL